MLYMVTFTINIPQMLAYIPYTDPMGYIIRISQKTIPETWTEPHLCHVRTKTTAIKSVFWDFWQTTTSKVHNFLKLENCPLTKPMVTLFRNGFPSWSFDAVLTVFAHGGSGGTWCTGGTGPATWHASESGQCMSSLMLVTKIAKKNTVYVYIYDRDVTYGHV